MSYLTYSEAPLFFRLNKSIIPYALDHCGSCHIFDAIDSKKPYEYITTLCIYTSYRMIKLIRPYTPFEENFESNKLSDIYDIHSIFLDPRADNIFISIRYKYDENAHAFSYVKKDKFMYELESSLFEYEQRIRFVTIDDILNRITMTKLISKDYYCIAQLFQFPSDEQLQINHDLIIQNSSPIYQPLTTLLLNTS